MPAEDERKDKPPKPKPDLFDLPELDEDTDLLELNVDLDPGAPEPIGELPVDEEHLFGSPEDDWIDLISDEPEATVFPEALRADVPVALAEDELEDFATQEALPILPWKLEAELLELGVGLPAVLDPTLQRSRWEKPNPTDATVHVTVRLRMLDIAIELDIVSAPSECLRVGRDILSGRVLISPD